MKKKTKIIFGIILFSILLLMIISVILYKKPTDCKTFSVDSCPNQCAVCPPCEVCSSISCNTIANCKKIGFDKSWYEDMKSRIISP